LSLLGNQAAGLDQEGGSPPLDWINDGKLTCVGDNCFDGTMHGGMHSNGVQPYDDYRHMNEHEPQLAARRADSPEQRRVRALARAGELAGQEEGQAKARLLQRPPGP